MQKKCITSEQSDKVKELLKETDYMNSKKQKFQEENPPNINKL